MGFPSESPTDGMTCANDRRREGRERKGQKAQPVCSLSIHALSLYSFSDGRLVLPWRDPRESSVAVGKAQREGEREGVSFPLSFLSFFPLSSLPCPSLLFHLILVLIVIPSFLYLCVSHCSLRLSLPCTRTKSQRAKQSSCWTQTPTHTLPSHKLGHARTCPPRPCP